jgi:hypothetical protein
MFALVAMVEAGVARRWESVSDPVAFSWRFSAEAAGSRAKGCGVLVVGDSLAKHGLIPRVIESATGRRAYNLAAAAAPAPLTYFLLRRAVDAGARPEALVVEFKPSVLAGGPRFRVRDWPEVLNPSEMAELALASRSGEFTAELILGALLPSFRARHDVRDALASALRGEPARLVALNAICRRNWEVNAGANVATPRPGFDGAVTEREHRELLSHRFGVHRVNAVYVRRTLDLAAATGARTYLLIPPFSPALADRRGRTGAEAGYTDFVRSLRERYPELTVLDARNSGYPASAFNDPTHLDRRGATTLSANVAAVVRRDTDPPKGGWINLPAFHAEAEPGGLEDVEQSRERLGIAWRP